MDSLLSGGALSHDHDHDHDHHDHDHGLFGHHHHHHDIEGVSDGRILVSIALNLLLTLAEVVLGLISGSVALLADAVHNFNDCAALLIAYGARRIGRRGVDERFTFGYRRAELVGALVNLCFLIAVGLFLVVESVERFAQPQEINGPLVMLAAGVALVIDVGTAALLWRMSRGNLNVRAAFLHNLTDAAASLAVLLGGLAIWLWGLTWLDPLLGLLIAAYILLSSVSMLRRTSAILMNNTPPGLDLPALAAAVEALPGVRGLHHLHVWELDEERCALEAHVVLERVDDWSVVCQAKAQIKGLLAHDFHIEHTTLEIESVEERCEEDGPPGSGPLHQHC